jgi:hypothetical protein
VREKNGVRFELRLLGVAEGRTSYEVTLDLAALALNGTASIDPESGTVTFAWPVAPPAWCEGAVRAQLRTLFRERAKGYPRRVTRWRPEPDVGGVE